MTCTCIGIGVFTVIVRGKIKIIGLVTVTVTGIATFTVPGIVTDIYDLNLLHQSQDIPAQELCRNLLNGFTIQKLAGLMSGLSSELDILVKMARLYWRVLYISTPSSKKKVSPLML